MGRRAVTDFPLDDARLDRVSGAWGDDEFSGCLLRPTDRQTIAEPAVLMPVLGIFRILLRPERGFLPVMADVFGMDLRPHLEHLLLIQRMRSSRSFIVDAEYRREALHNWCSQTLKSPGLVLLHPPSTIWQTQDEAARFLVDGARSQSLQLCAGFGSLGWAQICDDLLQYPIPLLVLPWDPEKGLLSPRRLPTKSFSQTLCVQRIGSRGLLLFDRYCLA